jgi:tetratricopeptide (TPR) repeat protein
MKHYFKILLTLTGGFFLTVIFLMLGGQLTFGYGLGDLFPLYIQIAWLIVLIISLTVIIKKKSEFNNIASGIFSAILLLSVFLSIKGFTVDRGSEYPWNGRIFTISYQEYKKLQEKKLIEKFEDLDKKIATDKSDIKSILEKAELLNENEKWEEAIVEYKNVISIDSLNFDANYGLADSYCGIEEYRKAVRQFEKAKEIDSTKNNVSNRIKNLKNYHKIK